MNDNSIKLLSEINRAIIKYRGVYSGIAKKQGISYNELLVLYTIRDNGFCTQKQICDSYLLPRQTINNVISDMRKKELLEISPKHCVAREKAFILTKKGKSYATPLINAITEIEIKAAKSLGEENIKCLLSTLQNFDEALQHNI